MERRGEREKNIEHKQPAFGGTGWRGSLARSLSLLYAVQQRGQMEVAIWPPEVVAKGTRSKQV